MISNKLVCVLTCLVWKTCSRRPRSAAVQVARARTSATGARRGRAGRVRGFGVVPRVAEGHQPAECGARATSPARSVAATVRPSDTPAIDRALHRRRHRRRRHQRTPYEASPHSARCAVTAKFHYTDQTGPDPTRQIRGLCRRPEFLGRRSSTVERPSTWTTAAGTYLRLLQTVSENSFIWRPKLLVTLLNV